MPCPNVEKCPLFPELKMQSGLRIWKTLFCENDAKFAGCERFKMASAGRMPHPRMLPNGKQLDEDVAG
jgi:hypothetical protein